MSLATGFYVQIGGVWAPLEDPQSGVELSVDRPSSSFISSGGKAYVQSALRSNRTWRFRYTHDSADLVRWLTAAAQGLLGPVYLLDVAAAQMNMLDPLTTVGRDTTQPTITVDGIPLRTFGIVTGVFTRMIRNAVPYRLTGWTTQTAASSLGTYVVNGGAPTTINAPAGTGSRQWTVTFTPGADGTVVFNTTVAGKVTALRLTQDTADTATWVPGENTPCQVSIVDPQRTLQMLQSGLLPQSDYTVTLREVG